MKSKNPDGEDDEVNVGYVEAASVSKHLRRRRKKPSPNWVHGEYINNALEE